MQLIGGKDKGAIYKKYNEADLVLKYAKSLQSKLETLGYKVFLTRDGSESSTDDLTKNVYDKDGKVTTTCESCSKLLISLNLNDAKSKSGGVEVYAPTECDLSFASLLAKNLVNTAKTSYSKVSSFKQKKGVYVRNFTEYDILSFKNSAKLNKYEPYTITKSTTYPYLLREIGGIATHAFVDGRNKSYGKNKFYNSNIGVEGYSIELGYITVEDDLNNILNNEALYTQAIANSIYTNFANN